MPAKTIEAFFKALPADRRDALAAVRAAINKTIPKGYEHGMMYGGPAWYVPTTRLAKTYNGQPLTLAVLGSQKNYMVLHLMAVYGDRELDAWFRKAYVATGKKLDMGKGCLRFKTLDALPLDVVGELMSKVSVDAYVSHYEATRAARGSTAKKAVGKTTKAKTKRRS